MGKSLFDKNTPQDRPPTVYERLEPEIAHLKKGSSVRYGAQRKKTSVPWLIVLAVCAFCWLYVMDPVMHAWYRGEAIRTYLYLHNYGAGPMANNLAATGIFSPDEIHVLDHRQGSFQDYYGSVDAANKQAETIIHYMDSVRHLHAGDRKQLDILGRVRYNLFIRPGIYLPTQWDFLNPSVGEEDRPPDLPPPPQ